MFKKFYLSGLLFLLSSSVVCQAGDVLVRLDPNGKKGFYNIPTRNFSAELGSAALYYSNQAENYLSIIQEVCAKHQVDSQLVKAVIQVESNYNPRALSPAGASGLMQLMPATAMRYGVQKIFDPWENIEGGVKYLRDLLALFNSDLRLAVAAYNAGENAVVRYNGIPNYIETQNYVRKVLALYNGDTSYTPYTTGIAKPRLAVY